MIGLKDLPVEDLNAEALGLNDYIESLTDFIMQCETPMTIALQGDWGSGKTSLMKLIEKSINPDKSKQEKYKIIWCNSWQYSQFHLQNEMSLLILQHIVNELKKDTAFAERAKDKFTQVGKAIGRIMFKAGVIAVAQGAGSGEAAEFLGDAIQGGSANFAHEIEELKTSLEKLIEARNDSKIIVFIDDLDRLLPEKAVEFLEVFKLFLDIKGCVYVLACDYHVISQGLKKKFGVGTSELKGKSFFDKIIQLPFTMPIGDYDTKKYYRKLLDDIGVKYKEKDLDMYERMGKYSIGFNPRGMKRLFNSLLLLKIVANKKNKFKDEIDGAKNIEKERIMFGVLCLQTAFESVYKYLQENLSEIDQELFDLLRDSNKIKNIKLESKLIQIKKELLEDNDGNEEILDKLALFMRAFFEALQLKVDDDTNSLSEIEIETLQSLISFSSVTSRDSSSMSYIDEGLRSRNRQMAKEFSDELDQIYRLELTKLRTSFGYTQPRDTHGIYIQCKVDLKEINSYFYIQFRYTDSGFILCLKGSKKPKETIKSWFEAKLKGTLDEEEDVLVIAKYEKSDEETIDEYEKEFKDQAKVLLNLFFKDLVNHLIKDNS